VVRNATMLEWNPIDTAPFGRDLELAVIDSEDAHALSFPCRRIEGGWIEVETEKRLYIRPSHWRDWSPGKSRSRFLDASPLFH
jgi:hypothetical protein